MRKLTQNLLRHEDGLTVVEYAIAAGLVVASIAGAFGLLGTAVDAIILAVVAFA